MHLLSSAARVQVQPHCPAMRKCSSGSASERWGRLSVTSCLIGCRNRPSHDPRDQPRHGHVLGDVALEPHGDHGETRQPSLTTSLGVCGSPASRRSPLFFQEAYSVARQFNQIPPICEQAEYHMFQREKVEVQLPELFHKIGARAPPTFCQSAPISL